MIRESSHFGKQMSLTTINMPCFSKQKQSTVYSQFVVVMKWSNSTFYQTPTKIKSEYKLKYLHKLLHALLCSYIIFFFLKPRNKQS